MTRDEIPKHEFKSKVIACVRDLSSIIDSIKRLVQKNAFQPSSIFNYQSGGNVYPRANGVAGADGMVSFVLDALKQGIYGGDAPRLHTVRSRMEKNQRQTILPPDLFQRFANDAFWQSRANLPKGVRIV